MAKVIHFEIPVDDLQRAQISINKNPAGPLVLFHSIA
jgi:hypothetical protein